MQGIVLQLQNYVLSAGIWAPAVYIFVMIIAIVASPIPSSPLTIFAGIVFGWMEGFALSLFGATIGAIIAFYIARWLGRPLVEKLVVPRKLAKIERMLPDQKLTFAVFILRILPLPFFDAISYAAGLTKIKFKNFLIATFFGLMPLTFVLSYFSELANNLVYFTLVVLLATFLFLFFIEKRAKNRGE
jgi:uncharacterized membrane protein YdjX (TVP38/TMEM64 family)